MGDSCDGHIYWNENYGAAAYCGCWCVAFIQRQYRIFRRTIQGIASAAWLHSACILQRTFLILWMELFEFCYRRAQRAIQVSVLKSVSVVNLIAINNINILFAEICRGPFALVCHL